MLADNDMFLLCPAASTQQRLPSVSRSVVHYSVHLLEQRATDESWDSGAETGPTRDLVLHGFISVQASVRVSIQASTMMSRGISILQAAAVPLLEAWSPPL